MNDVTDLDQFHYNCDHLEKLEQLDLSHNSLDTFLVNRNCENMTSLRRLSLSHNNIRVFDVSVLSRFPSLEYLDLSNNDGLEHVEADNNIGLDNVRTVDLSNNPSLQHVCDIVLHSLTNMSELILTNTNIVTKSWTLFQLLYPDHTPDCDCQLMMEEVEENQQCDHAGATVSVSNIPELLDCSPSEIVRNSEILANEETVFDSEMLESANRSRAFAGESLMLDCPHTGDPDPAVLWLTPRLELITLRPDPGHLLCPGVQDSLSLCDTLCTEENAYKPWPGHFTLLDNGSLLIDQFGWRDRGEFSCYVDNKLGNDSITLNIDLDPRYRHVIYLWSLLYGLVTCVGFLIFTMVCKLVHYLLWNYGCCYCCACCHHDPPPKIKRLAAALDSIEQYRSITFQQLLTSIIIYIICYD